MPDPDNALKTRLHELVDSWENTGLSGRQTMMDIAHELANWKQSQNIRGLWPHPPLFLTATMDDAWGHGLELIETYARILGLEVCSLGLEKSSTEIITACVEKRPAYLGLTVLQLDTLEDLAVIRKSIPHNTTIIAGGPVLKFDAEHARQAGVDLVAKNLSEFIQFFLLQHA